MQNNMSIPKEILFESRLKRNPSCGIIVVDNFYSNPNQVREYILQQDFSVIGNYPGKRTKSFATEELKNIFQNYVRPFGGNITDFPMQNTTEYNGAFQYTTCLDRSWVHIDGYNNWGGIIYLTPNAPLSSGTGFFQFEDGSIDQIDQNLMQNKDKMSNYYQDMTKWKLVDRIGNVYNRLILFNSKKFHMSMDYFGKDIQDGRLFQVFFFSTEI